MNYKTKITPQGNGKYIGQLLEHGQVIYSTNELTDPILVSRELAQYIATLKEPVAIAPKINSLPTPGSYSPPAQNVSPQTTVGVGSYRKTPPARKCCGRS